MAPPRIILTQLQVKNLKRLASKRKRLSPSRTHSEALDQLAAEHGFANWSLLQKAAGKASPAAGASADSRNIGFARDGLTIHNAQFESAVRDAFKSNLFGRLLTDSLDSLSGNPNGTTFACDRNGKTVCLDATGALLKDGANLLQAIMGVCTSKKPVLEMDVIVNQAGFCLTAIGPPVSDVISWTIARRENVHPESYHAIAAHVDL